MPQINVDISKFYKPVNQLRWTWEADQEIHTQGSSSGKIQTSYGIDGRPDISGKMEGTVTSHKIVNHYILNVRYEGAVDIGDRNVIRDVIPNYWADANVKIEARKRTGISGEGDYLSCGQCLCVCVLGMTIICCGVAKCLAEAGRAGRQRRLQEGVDVIANHYFEQHVAKLVSEADKSVANRIAQVQARQNQSQIPQFSQMGTQSNMAMTPELYQQFLQFQQFQKTQSGTQIPLSPNNANRNQAPLMFSNQLTPVVPSSNVVKFPSQQVNLTTSTSMSSLNTGNVPVYNSPQMNQTSQEGMPSTNFNALASNSSSSNAQPLKQKI